MQLCDTVQSKVAITSLMKLSDIYLYVYNVMFSVEGEKEGWQIIKRTLSSL